MPVPIIGERLGDDQLVVLADGHDIGEVSIAAKSLQTLTPLFSKSDPPGALVTELSWAAVVQLAALYGTWWRPQPKLQAWITDQVQRRTARSPLSYRPPAPMVPYWWQSEGADLIAATGRALITDEPGTGKTGTAVLGLVEWASRQGSKALGVLPVMPGPVIVVCPASVVDNWVREWQMWAPHVRAVAWRGPKRSALVGTADVYVTSFDLARTDAADGSLKSAHLRALKATALVIDECHFVKNGQAARTKAVVRLASEVHKRQGAIVGLSGTPITRDVGDLHPMLKILEPHAWPAKERMIARYALSIPGDYDDEILGLNPWTKDEFHLCLLGQHRRIAKADVLADLPPKVYTYRTVDLPAKWKKAYDDFEENLYAELPDGTELSVMDAMSAYTHLSTMSSAPGTVEITYGPDVDEETGEEKRHVHIELDDYVPGKPSWKIAALLDLLTERKGLQTVVFAPSRPLLTKIAGPALEHAGFKVGYVVGGQSAGARTRDVDAFQARQLDVLLATTGAGGVGLTFTAADTVIVLQRPWELDHSIQLEDRLHRIGAAHESIQIIDVIARDTIDTRRRESLKGKVRHLAEVVQDSRLASELLGGKNAVEHPLARNAIGVAV